ncbi:MAG TPA: hypothetical protein VH105_05055 [Burkholderiales bacterium]|jgi:hypothetical protein|nr:hypothetical protein [Burkholderiales bacterium]
MAKLDHIHAKLIEASRLLDEAAREMRELQGSASGAPREQVSKIGAAIAEVMLVRHQIYIQRPDLMPGYLQEADRTGSSAGKSAASGADDSDSSKRTK